MTQTEYFNQVDQAYDTLRGFALEARLSALAEQAGDEHGRDSGVYASVLSELGGYYRGQGRYTESADTFRRVICLLKASVGERSPAYATALNNLAGTYRLMGEYDKAEQSFLLCLGICEQTVGRRHVLYAAGLNNLSLLALDRKEPDQAARLLHQASDILSGLPECRDEYATSLVNLAALYRQLGQHEKAQRNLLEAVRLYENELGTDTPHYHTALNALGLACADLGLFSQARIWLDKAIRAAETLYGPEHPDVQSIRAHLAALVAREARLA